MTLAKYVGLGALAVGAAACTPKPPPPPAAAAAMQQLPPGRIYTFHSSAQSGCPGLDWHVVLTPDNMLDGMVAWNNWQSMAHASGTINPQARTFQMTAEELGGQHRTADISGTVRSDGYLVANISGPNVNCQGIMVGWSAPPPPVSEHLGAKVDGHRQMAGPTARPSAAKGRPSWQRRAARCAATYPQVSAR